MPATATANWDPLDANGTLNSTVVYIFGFVRRKIYPRPLLTTRVRGVGSRQTQHIFFSLDVVVVQKKNKNETPAASHNHALITTDQQQTYTQLKTVLIRYCDLLLWAVFFFFFYFYQMYYLKMKKKEYIK